ncbi:hypothetical protein [Faecalicatena faecalis]|uniref:hypothetical protein n=1 Tax=Faecalicatena faecalis TaxID=2726362 RepID=UPI001C0CD3AC|nr:hypothetical protein [Faecalicatena faecalis]
MTTPTDTDYWKYHSESFSQNGVKKWGRSNASQNQGNNYIASSQNRSVIIGKA